MSRLTPILLVLALLWGTLAGCSDDNPPPPRKRGGLAVGDMAYDFRLLDSQGQWIRFADVEEGWFTVLVFYRGSWCAACVNHLNEIKAKYDRFLSRRAALMAVSVESVNDLAEFQHQWRFPFPVLSDMRLRVVDAYGARDPKKNSGQYISRNCTVIIDPKKRVRYKYVGMHPHDVPHIAEILELIDKFRGTPSP